MRYETAFYQTFLTFAKIVGDFKEFLKKLLLNVTLKLPRHCFLTNKCSTWYAYIHKKLFNGHNDEGRPKVIVITPEQEQEILGRVRARSQTRCIDVEQLL